MDIWQCLVMILANLLTTGLIDIIEPTKEDNNCRNGGFRYNVVSNRGCLENSALFNQNDTMYKIPSNS